MPRKIIQISACGVPDTDTAYGYQLVFALCDDGTLWSIDYTVTEPNWKPVPPIPQDVAKRAEYHGSDPF